jgi:hypothetical protein
MKYTFASILFLIVAKCTIGQRGPGGPGGFGGPGKDMDGPGAPPGVTLFNNTCPADTSTTNGCFVGRPGNKTRGAWVCRTIFDLVTGEERTFSACVALNGFIETDTCGCCDGTCPSTDPCGCACNMTGSFGPPFNRELQGPGDRRRSPPRSQTTTGVLVTMLDEEKCVPANISVKLTTGPGFFGQGTCVTSCT